MRISGTAYNGNAGDAAEGAVVTLRVGTETYSTFVGSDGTWMLQIPGNPGTNSTLTMTFSGRTRTLSTSQIVIGQPPSWTPSWMSALAHRTASGVSRNGVVPSELGSFQVTVVGGTSLQISGGVVAHTDASDSENWWVASWEETTSYGFKEWDGSAYVDVASGDNPTDGWLLGVERLSDGRCIYNLARVSGSDATTDAGTYTGIIGGFSDNFIPLARITRSGLSITSVTRYRNTLFEGRVSFLPIQSLVGGSAVGNIILEDDESSTLTTSVLTITDRTAGNYFIDAKSVVMAVEPSAVSYWTGKSSFGSLGSGDTTFNHPDQVACDSSGNIYVADTGNNRLKKHQANGAYVTSITGLTDIRGVCVDSSDNIYVSYNPSVSAYWVRKYNSSLVAQWSIFLYNSPIASLSITPNGSHLSTALPNVTIVNIYNTVGESHTTIGGAGSTDGKFSLPTGIAADSGYIYVADRGNSRVQKFTTSGTFVTKWGSFGTGNGQFQQPYGVAVHPTTGNIWVTDYSRGNVQEFTNTGTYVGSVSAPGDPAGIAFSPDGLTMYVSDFTYDTVSIFTYVSPPDGGEWLQLEASWEYKKNAGSWTSFGTTGTVPTFASRPDFLTFRVSDSVLSLASGDTIQFRYTLTNNGSGSVVYDNMNYQVRLIPLEAV